MTPQAACEEDVSRKSALVGYLKSKLRLQETQREAWQDLEQVVSAAIERLHLACDQLPAEAGDPPDFVASMDMVVRRLSADLEFLQAIREPVGAVYDKLSPKQRLMLQPFGVPGLPL